MRSDEVCVIGAGPYGLVTAAHLRAAGLRVRIFGDVMSFWRAMPKGMLLRSTREGISLSDPENSLSLDDYERAQDKPLATPIERSEFIRYVEWYQRQATPNVDKRSVKRLDRIEGGFRLQLCDGELFDVPRVVVAIGLGPFTRRLPVLESLPEDRASHSLQLMDCSIYQGERVMVVGSGQSALESATMLSLAGADVELLSRGEQIYWLAHSDHINRESSILKHILYPPGAIGPPGINWVVQLPWLYRSMPGAIKSQVFRRAVRPAASGRMRSHVEQAVTQTYGRSLTSATMSGGRIHVRLDDGSERRVDHIVQGTGFEVDIARFGFLSPEIVASAQLVGRQPRVGAGFESSIPGLFFMGAASDMSYGPLMRAIAGTGFAASSVARRVAASAAGKATSGWGRAMETIEQGLYLAPSMPGSAAAVAGVGLLMTTMGGDASLLQGSSSELAEVSRIASSVGSDLTAPGSQG
jgi:thioredoxin reductase